MSFVASTAVMQRRVEAPDSLDDYPTPPWATRALCEVLEGEGHDLSRLSAWEPCCNRGHMARPLAEAFGSVFTSDVMDCGWDGQQAVADFLIDWAQEAPEVDFVITNPPFRLAAEVIARGLERARIGVAVFVRTAFVEGVSRYETLFRDRPEALVLPFVERVVLWRGVLLDPEVPVWREGPDGAGRLERPTSATSYCWLVWLKDRPSPTLLRRIPPCRLRLTRPGDYPPLPAHLRAPVEDVPGLPLTHEDETKEVAAWTS